MPMPISGEISATTRRHHLSLADATRWIIPLVLVTIALLGCQPPPAQQPISVTPIQPYGTAPAAMTAPSGAPLATNSSAGLAILLAPETPVPLPLGQAIRVRLSSSVGGFAQLYLVNSSGRVVLLAENFPLRAGEETIYPRAADNFALQAQPPAGVERLILLVTRQPFAGFAAAPGVTITRPMVLNAAADTVIGQINARTAALPRTEWAATELRIQTGAAGI